MNGEHGPCPICGEDNGAEYELIDSPINYDQIRECQVCGFACTPDHWNDLSRKMESLQKRKGNQGNEY